MTAPRPARAPRADAPGAAEPAAPERVSRIRSTPQRTAALGALIQILAERLVRDEMDERASEAPPAKPR